jgi:hypothetical protein
MENWEPAVGRKRIQECRAAVLILRHPRRGTGVGKQFVSDRCDVAPGAGSFHKFQPVEPQGTRNNCEMSGPGRSVGWDLLFRRVTPEGNSVLWGPPAARAGAGWLRCAERER